MISDAEKERMEHAADLYAATRGCTVCKRFATPETGRVTRSNMLRHMVAKHNYTLKDRFGAVQAAKQPPLRERILRFFMGG